MVALVYISFSYLAPIDNVIQLLIFQKLLWIVVLFLYSKLIFKSIPIITLEQTQLVTKLLKCGIA